ncbi:phospho-N-acetylmuramoyl-pentapeptide-transferase [Lyngbya confervoides]|uniref:Phospho-N-acetylmuramoyl-pentapeptide-transferase n=1 Tax=Lyngbya confervoides BDU141951 TaxID=1574623 RepID=A0ABD4SZ95_9CYAN|nr:phospho-N-acetylmuramoyl-pentapeptide-transferase [Lyngbya confervoides]MCM1981797.1 phospho-N-acetylmuramoyl-pentapeptide-transferase [Lyngbya confervoides BDU141951]
MQVSEQAPLISGKGLYVGLCLGLLAITVGADALSGRFLTPLTSITLPFVVTALVTSILGLWVVPLLKQLKAGQVIREDGPQQHLQKAGTPTMGGVFFIPVGLGMSIVLCAVGVGKVTPNLIASGLLTLTLGGLGWVDDLQVLLKKSNRGISAKLRLGIEIVSGGAFTAWLLWSQPAIATVQLPFGLSLSLGIFFALLAIFVVAAESNAVNLTDGMDGLAAGTAAIAFLGLALIVAPTDPDLQIFCACLGGGCLGFLSHNHNPARVFMGDTGSLALGAGLAAVGLTSNNLWALLILSGLFLAESVSVIAQVLFYKATKDSNGVGQRLLKMAPLHHHYELSGWPETKVVGVFYLVGLGLAAFSVGLDQLR